MELGIKGNPTRSKEVIKILEMLGGENHCNLIGDDDRFFYYIYINDKYIYNSYIGPDEIKGYKIFSLEEFLENFPYKVGDKVNVWVNYEHFAGPRAELEEAEIRTMRWNCGRCEVAYRMKNQTGEFYKSDIKGKVDDGSNKQSECEQCGRVFGSVKCFDVDCPSNTPNYVAEFKDDKVNGDDEEQKIDPTIDYAEIAMNELRAEYGEMWKETIMDALYKTGITHDCLKERGFNLPDGFHFVDENGKSIDASKIKLVKNSPYYPKSYDECCDVLNIPNDERYIDIDVPLSYNKLLSVFVKLLICQDAYWKIAGEYLDLDKPWEPEWTNPNIDLYVIINGCYNEIYEGKYERGFGRCILAFPTIEMQKAFLNNFKDLIEICKELL